MPFNYQILTLASLLSLTPNTTQGTCVNVGCVPKKVMWNTATLAESIHDAKDYGFDIDASATKFDWSIIKTSRDAYIKRLNVRTRAEKGVQSKLWSNFDKFHSSFNEFSIQSTLFLSLSVALQPPHF